MTNFDNSNKDRTSCFWPGMNLEGVIGLRRIPGDTKNPRAVFKCVCGKEFTRRCDWAKFRPAHGWNCGCLRKKYGHHFGRITRRKGVILKRDPHLDRTPMSGKGMKHLSEARIDLETIPVDVHNLWRPTWD